MGDSNPRDQNPELGATIRVVVERQLQQPDLEEVNEAVDRLMDQGHSRDQAIDAVGAVLLEEMQEMMSETESFDRARYRTRLRNL